MPAKKQILVLRFSAMGDVAMCVPVIKTLLDQNPEVDIVFASRAGFKEFFSNIPRVTYFAADFNKAYRGWKGVLKLFGDLKKEGNFTALADLHDNLRTKILRRLFRLRGLSVAYIDKGRSEKKQLTRFPGKILKPLKRTTERYADVFRKLHFTVNLDYNLDYKPRQLTKDIIKITGQKITPWVGIAPFAKHTGKIYPPELTEKVIALLDHKEVRIFLFGGSEPERELCLKWQQRYGSVISLVQELTMEQELIAISNLNVMVSMDSAGMHLASLEGVPVVSVWGATHHYAGFLGYGQSEKDVVGDDLECRPCSVYGNKPCFRKDYACLHRILPETIVSKVENYL
ncbi:MAG TPA: glycosyltransferase family 9 protein [Mucilaginibacter sp.]|nr:glycosyltransferase family 9 protein [Mucilaginibacter sp.]